MPSAVMTAPGTPAERREQSLSFGDQRQIVYQALIAHLADGAADDDGEIDIWIQDLSTDWVVWYSYTTSGPGAGTWRLTYSLGDDNVVTFSGDPEAVVEQTSYVPASDPEAKNATVPARPARRTEGRSVPVADLETRKSARSALRNVREMRRCPAEFELRDAPNGTGGNVVVFTGFACVTGDDATYEMEDWVGPWTESVSVGAFAKTLREADVAFLVNHEGLTLARSKGGEGTMTLAEVTSGNPTGLHVEARLDTKNPYVKALRSAVERGDLDEMSFAFRVVRQEWSEDYDRRWINEVNLDKGDVSAANYGANPHTGGTVAMRKAGSIGIEARAFMAALAEVREGKTLSASTMTVLQRVLDLTAAADEAVDEAQPLLAELMGVPNPDVDDPAAGQLASPVPLIARNRVAEARARLARYKAA